MTRHLGGSAAPFTSFHLKKKKNINKLVIVCVPYVEGPLKGYISPHQSLVCMYVQEESGGRGGDEGKERGRVRQRLWRVAAIIR